MISRYYSPTRVVFGKGAEEEVGKELVLEGARKVLIHYGGSSAEKSGLLDRVRTSLREKNIPFVELGGVKPNPRLGLVREGIELSKKEEVNYILAVGGGSVIDSAKAIGYGLYNGGEVWDFYDGTRKPYGSTPIGVILTLSATGSELSDSSVITNEEGNLKRGCNSDFCRPRFALLNPELTYTVPKFQTEVGTIDIMMHTIERFFHSGEGLDFTDRLACTLIKDVMEKGLRVLEEPEDYDARASLMWASSLSHNGLMALGNDQRGDWACHQLEHELSGMFDIAHGEGLAIIFPAWSTYVYKEDPDRFAKMGHLVFGIEEKGEEGAKNTIEAFKKCFRKFEMPLSLKEAGIELSDEQLEELLDKATFYGKRTLGAFKTLEREDMKEIYLLAK